VLLTLFFLCFPGLALSRVMVTVTPDVRLYLVRAGWKFYWLRAGDWCDQTVCRKLGNVHSRKL